MGRSSVFIVRIWLFFYPWNSDLVIYWIFYTPYLSVEFEANTFKACAGV